MIIGALVGAGVTPALAYVILGTRQLFPALMKRYIDTRSSSRQNPVSSHVLRGPTAAALTPTERTCDDRL
jgi:hypothetical protein